MDVRRFQWAVFIQLGIQLDTTLVVVPTYQLYLYFYIYKPCPDTWFPISTSLSLGPGATVTTSGRYAAPSSVSDSSVSASPPPSPTPLLCVDWLHGLDLTDQKHVSFDIDSYLENGEELYNNCQQQPCSHAHPSIPQVCYYFWEEENSIILPSNPAQLHSHFLCHSPVLNLALVNNQNHLQQAITNFVNRPTHESSDKTAKPAPFKGKPAKLNSFLSLFILWAGEQKWLKLDSGKLDPRKCIAEALLMMEGPAAEWATEYARHISGVRADEAGAVFPWEGNWDNFTHALKIQFRVANEQQLAKNKLEALKQGDKTVVEFSQIFKMWAEKTGFSDQDLQYKFRKHLHKDLFKYGARTEGGP
ncbi:hypothetical protein D9758_010307 [Tetrapyrgos nigripes]|uniref:Retrotransposon gag domain-containing protein n=1 Tax=Tetrapyrgos nigripes TaxID=182062 RepID=A0A8H5LL91_9AGAR|nr:hypothetical protein D9758_010307 [Tetrapyrgos nigripes]